MRYFVIIKIKQMIVLLAALLLVAGCSTGGGIAPTSDGGQDTDSQATQISDEIRIEGVNVTAEQVILRGKTSFPDSVCLHTQLWADGELLDWWPAEQCASLHQGDWELAVDLAPQNMLQPGVQYQARAYQEGEPERLSIFPFDLDGPPMPEP